MTCVEVHTGSVKHKDSRFSSVSRSLEALCRHVHDAVTQCPMSLRIDPTLDAFSLRRDVHCLVEGT